MPGRYIWSIYKTFIDMDQKAITRTIMNMAAVLLCFLGLHASAQNTYNEKDLQKLKDVLDAYAADLNLPSYSAYVAVGDDLEGAWAYGYANIEEKLQATVSTCYQCASLTKSFAATVIMQLTEQGIMDLKFSSGTLRMRISCPRRPRRKPAALFSASVASLASALESLSSQVKNTLASIPN